MASTSARPATAATFQPVDSAYLRSAINRLTIPQIKPLLKEVSAIAGVALPAINVRKNVLVESLNRIVTHLQTEERQHQYMAAIRAIEAKYGGSLTSHSRPSYPPYPGIPPPGLPARPPPQQHHNTIGQNPNANYYSDYHSAIQQQRTAQVAPKVGTFKESPFYTLKEWIHPSVMCAQVPEHARPAGSAKISFNLTAAQCGDLANASSRKEARLFCTTFAASRASEARHPAPIEFPINCEVRVNRIQLSVNLRGRKGPAKVQPPNLNKDKKLNLSTGRNEVELTYVHTYQPYILTIGICETVSAEELVEQVKKESVKSKETVLKEMKRAADDDDIEVGDVTVNLKCPLSYMRLKTPCRSSVCTHIQCFDAFSFYSINEQTPSWQCPICSRTVDPKQIFVDEYVLDILQRVPESEESVQIDSEGRWKTPNNKYRSDDVAANGAATGSANNTPSKIAVAAKEDGTNSPLPLLPRVKGEDEANPRLDFGASTSNEPDTTEGQQRSKKRTIDVVDLDDSPSPPGAAPQKEASEPANVSNGVPTTNLNTLNGGSIQAAGRSSTTSAGDAIMGQSVDSTSTEPSRPAVIDLTFSDSEDEDQPLRQQMPIIRPIPGRPPIRPPAIPSKPSDVAIRAPGSIMPMPLPGQRLGNGLQSIDRFLVPRNQAGPSSGRASPSPFNDGMTNAHRSSSFTNGTNTFRSFTEWNRNSPSLASREFDVAARPRSGLQHSASFNNEPTFRSGIFHAPSSPNEPLNTSRGHTQPPSDPINEENAPASSQTQDEDEAVDQAAASNNVNAGRTPTNAGEDEDGDPISRPRKRTRVVNDAEDEDEEDELDLDPDAGFATPNGRTPTQSNGDHGKSNGNSSYNDDSNSSRMTNELTDRLFDRRPNQESNGATSSGSKTGPIAYRNTMNDMDDMSDDDFEADERAGFGFN